MDLTPQEIKRALENPASQPRLSASTLERFDAARLASVLEAEINRSQVEGLSHISLNMNLIDCAAMAKFLRRGALLGA